MKRCDWVSLDDPVYVAYHDQEWGVPVHDDRLLFEFLILEGMQAGLSWKTILNKRENFRKAFDDFDAQKIALYGEDKVAALLTNAGIIRNRLKINAAISNARLFLNVQEEVGSFDKYMWSFVDGRTIHNSWKRMDEIPAHTPESSALSKDLLRRGFKFVGSTIMYAHMQAIGMVNDHTVDCFRYRELVELG